MCLRRAHEGIRGKVGLGLGDDCSLFAFEVSTEVGGELGSGHFLGEFFLAGVRVKDGDGVGAGLVEFFFHKGEVHGALEVLIGFRLYGSAYFRKGLERFDAFFRLFEYFCGRAGLEPGDGIPHGGNTFPVVRDLGDAFCLRLRDALAHQHFRAAGIRDEGALHDGGLGACQTAYEEGGSEELVWLQHAFEFLPVVVPVVVCSRVYSGQGGDAAAHGPLDDGFRRGLYEGFFHDACAGLEEDVFPQGVGEGFPGLAHEGELAHEPARAGEAAQRAVGDFFHSGGGSSVNKGGPFRSAGGQSRVVGAVALVIVGSGEGQPPACIGNEEGGGLAADAAQAVDGAGGEGGALIGGVAQVLAGGEEAEDAGVFLVVFEVGLVVSEGFFRFFQHFVIVFMSKGDEVVLLAVDLEEGAQGGVSFDDGAEEGEAEVMQEFVLVSGLFFCFFHQGVKGALEQAEGGFADGELPCAVVVREGGGDLHGGALRDHAAQAFFRRGGEGLFQYGEGGVGFFHGGGVKFRAVNVYLFRGEAGVEVSRSPEAADDFGDGAFYFRAVFLVGGFPGFVFLVLFFYGFCVVVIDGGVGFLPGGGFRQFFFQGEEVEAGFSGVFVSRYFAEDLLAEQGTGGQGAVVQVCLGAEGGVGLQQGVQFRVLFAVQDEGVELFQPLRVRLEGGCGACGGGDEGGGQGLVKQSAGPGRGKGGGGLSRKAGNGGAVLYFPALEVLRAGGVQNLLLPVELVGVAGGILQSFEGAEVAACLLKPGDGVLV